MSTRLKEKLTELSIELANKDLQKMKQADPEKYDQTLELMVLLTEIATHFLQESQEFREKFAQIHAEFLQHPERKQVIQESITAYGEYTEQN